MARRHNKLTALLLLSLVTTLACKPTEPPPPPDEAGESKPATVEELDWKQRVAIKNDEIKRKDPGTHQQLMELQSKPDAAGVPSLDGPLIEANPDAAPVLVTRMLGEDTKKNKQAIAGALPRTGGDWSEAAAALIPLAADPEVRKALVESMRYAEDPHAVEGLKHGFQDEVPEIRAAAARTAGFSESGRMLYNELLSGLFAEDWDMRAASAQSLGKLQMREATSALRRSLNDEHEQVRLYSLLALEKIDPENVGSFPEVEKLRSDPSQPVANEANRISKR